MTQNEIDKIKEDIQVLQNRMGGAEYLIKVLVQKMHPNEIAEIENEIQKNIQSFGQNSTVVDIFNESLRLLGK